MDPQATWDLMLGAYVREDWPEVHEHGTALSAWLTRGGFPPTIVADPPGLIDPEFHTNNHTI